MEGKHPRNIFYSRKILPFIKGVMKSVKIFKKGLCGIFSKNEIRKMGDSFLQNGGFSFEGKPVWKGNLFRRKTCLAG